MRPEIELPHEAWARIRQERERVAAADQAIDPIAGPWEPWRPGWTLEEKVFVTLGVTFWVIGFVLVTLFR